MVINKPPGESSEFPVVSSPGKIFPVHRLDTPVSGCLLLARNPEAAAFLCNAFTRPDSGVEKRYWAIVEKPREEIRHEAELVHWLVENKKTNKVFAYTESSDRMSSDRMSGGKLSRGAPKKAVLRYRVAGQGDHYLFLEIDLITGRHHQIRAQLAALGLHIKGDLKYGARRSEKSGGIRLHAFSLAFPNPLAPDEIIRVTAPPPSDALWAAFAEALRMDYNESQLMNEDQYGRK
jgi:23S rRNA pseudouridine1911/1915/1917 synthase